MKYKDMTYTIRKNGLLMKKKQYNNKTYCIYANNVQDLYNKWIDLNYNINKGDIGNGRILFKNYAEKWLRFNSHGKAEATVKEYKYIVNKYLIGYFGNYPIDKIKREHVQSLQADLLINNHYELAHKCIRFMRTICNEAIADDYLRKNPCLNIKEPKIVHKEKQILTQDQDNLLLKSTHKYATFFRILRYTGLRREEITPLTTQDVDIERRTILINKAVSFISNQPKLKETKNKKSRTIPILDIICDEVVDLLNYCNENNQKYLFVKQDGNMLSQESIRCMTISICKELGFYFTPHQLRHSYCTMLYYSGIKIKETQNLMRTFFSKNGI